MSGLARTRQCSTPLWVVTTSTAAVDPSSWIWWSAATGCSSATSTHRRLPTICSEHNDVDCLAHAALVGNALYFKFEIYIQAFRSKIIKYDLSTLKMSAFYLPYQMSLWSTFTIDLPLSHLEHGLRIVLMATEDDARLGFGAVHDSKLYLWNGKPLVVVLDIILLMQN